jgi:hypothetical protein
VCILIQREKQRGVVMAAAVDTRTLVGLAEQAQQELSFFSEALMRERAALLLEQQERAREAAAAREMDRCSVYSVYSVYLLYECKSAKTEYFNVRALLVEKYE